MNFLIAQKLRDHSTMRSVYSYSTLEKLKLPQYPLTGWNCGN
jgi:hypothetical protein